MGKRVAKKDKKSTLQNDDPSQIIEEASSSSMPADGPKFMEFAPQDTPPTDPTVPWRDREMILHLPKVDQYQAVMYREKMDKLKAQASAKRLYADKVEWQAQQKVLSARLEAKRTEEEVEEVRAEYEALLIRMGRKFGLGENKQYRVDFLHTHGFDSETGKVVNIAPEAINKEI